MAHARSILIPTYYLISCYILFLAAYATPRAAALSFDYDFTVPIPRDRKQLKFINASYAGRDRIILTDDSSNLTGRVVHRKPVRLWDSRTGRRASFTTSFRFAIVQDSNRTDNLSRGDGMAFFLGPFPATTPPPGSDGGLLGLFSNPNSTGAADSRRPPHTLAVEFDTRWNHGWDPSNGAGADHIGVDVNGIRSNRTRSLPPLSLHGIMWASVTYDAESKVMKVALRKTELASESSTTYEFNATMDLRDDAGLVQDAAVGFSAATGVLCESHQLLAWSFHSTDPSHMETKMWVIFLSVTAVLLAGLLVALLPLLYTTFMKRPRRCLDGNCLQVARKFSYSELVAATGNFSQDRKIGKGSFGDVYRGLLPVPDLREVAVKEMRQPTLKRNRKNYVHEIETLCQLRHKNLLRLIGWCDDGGRLVLVYELEPNGSVSDHLHDGGTSGRILTWPQRYNILLGIAAAIDYIHNGAYDSTKRYVLHRDIKPSNVMLGEGFEAKLGDFGLVRQVIRHGGGGTPRTTVIGSMDYMDPKYIELGTLSSASDIYSFGLVLLEVATGVRPSVPGTAAHRNTLIAAVTESHRRKAILEMVDEQLRGELNQWWWQMERVMVTGLACVEPARDERPSIKDVIDLLSKHEQSPASSRYLKDTSMRPKDRLPFILTRNVALANARATSLP
ncbi:L-type lectin-domain containing receptor kinase IX.2 [Aegilops tauschii subsp. strangulata]|uniref:non-specific serine/threonine protein kinase n=1 Tax=Aegilops tauschii subsp. strangulata TaxID=200361 RepID=A0A453AEH1_AEGTS|nr:L-type lectin-domain containing receptor kinase IX.2 [Aegilops tauschii subsp. strangulata]